jgi:para-nitrobenzyl esterase
VIFIWLAGLHYLRAYPAPAAGGAAGQMMGVVLVRTLAAAAAVMTAAGGAPVRLPVQVHLPGQGTILGFHDQPTGSRSFLGVPFAAPPVGPLRWQLPRPHPPWSGVRGATSWMPGCLSGGKGPSHENGTAWSEDCLGLNIFTPQQQGEEKEEEEVALLPVLFFYHGGTSSARIYPAGRLANTTRSVVITAQYRQGPFGYLVLPELLASGALNLASEDSLFALQWVQKHVRAFGGDPRKVSIFGQRSAPAG